MAHIACWRSGEVEVLRHAPYGSISLMKGPPERLTRILEVVARHAHDGKTLLVPGLPEADDDDAALHAIMVFQTELERRV